MKKIFHILLIFLSQGVVAQVADTIKPKAPEPKKEKNALKFNLNDDGSHFFQVTFLNQTWVRLNESNDSTTLFNRNAPTTTDIGLRRTRIQMFGQISDRTFIYFQFGQNNFNNTFNWAPTSVTSGSTTTNIYGNRKLAPFFHDALCEFKVTKNNALKLGGGLTVMNGLSRFSQPSVSSIMTLDLPVFLQYSVDQIDQFDRRLAIYARGQISKLDYRIYFSNPFPISSSGSAPKLSPNVANFVDPTLFGKYNGKGPGINNQYGGYFAWNFFDVEPHTTPYMTGTFLGTKKIFNIALGAVYQKAATWYLAPDANGAFIDTTYCDMLHLGVETFLDMPLNKEKGTAVSAFAGYYNTNYGNNYIRYNGLMNPATGSIAKTSAMPGNSYGNAFPMFGTGQIVYTQFGFLLPKSLLGEKNGQLMPYASAQYADMQALQHKAMVVYDVGCNWLIKGHNSKLSLEYQSRPTYYKNSIGDVQQGSRKSCVILQYQIFI